jgi:hypothetical protein
VTYGMPFVHGLDGYAHSCIVVGMETPDFYLPWTNVE